MGMRVIYDRKAGDEFLFFNEKKKLSTVANGMCFLFTIFKKSGTRAPSSLIREETLCVETELLTVITHVTLGTMERGLSAQFTLLASSFCSAALVRFTDGVTVLLNRIKRVLDVFCA